MEDYTRIFHSPRDRWVSAYKHKGKTRRKSGLLLVWLQRCYALKESLPSSFCHVETLSVPVLDSFSRHSLSASSDCILLREQFALRKRWKAGWKYLWTKTKLPREPYPVYVKWKIVQCCVMCVLEHMAVYYRKIIRDFTSPFDYF